MKILILGSEGFIGSHLVNFFLQDKRNEVFGCDLLDVKNSSYEYFKISRLNPDYQLLFENHKYDLCIDAAGNGSVPISVKYPFNNFEANVVDTFHLLENIRVHNPGCKLVYFSSAAVYGNPKSLPVAEDSELKPLSPYGWHKYIGEIVCREYYSLYNIPVVILRPFSVYGPGLKKQLIWDLHAKFLKGEGVLLFGTGNESRDFIFIRDMIQAISIILEYSNFEADIYNIACGKEIKISEIVKTYVRVSNSRNGVSYTGESRKGDPLNWKADISKLENMGFKPSYTFDMGMSETYKWLVNNEKN